MKSSDGIVEDFDSIRRYLNRLENERARSVSAPSIVAEENPSKDVEESKSKDRTSISQLWMSGKV